MPGFNDNLKRAREAAGLSPEDLASRIGAAPLWLAHLEAIGAALPELSHLVKLADALGCSLDDLLAGRDEEFDHPRRRHAALIAARLGSVSLLLGTVNRARARGTMTSVDDARVNEAALLACVHRCRAWVTSPDADISIASSLEQDLDTHIARISSVCARPEDTPGRAGGTATTSLAQTARPATAAVTAVPPPQASAARVPKDSAVSLLDALAPGDRTEAATPETVSLPSPDVAPPPPPRPPGHRTSMWSRPSDGADDYVCEMYTANGAIIVRLVCGARVLASKDCRNLDEAFSQSGSWKRLPNPESLTGGPLPASGQAGAAPLPTFKSGAA